MGGCFTQRENATHTSVATIRRTVMAMSEIRKARWIIEPPLAGLSHPPFFEICCKGARRNLPGNRYTRQFLSERDTASLKKPDYFWSSSALTVIEVFAFQAFQIFLILIGIGVASASDATLQFVARPPQILVPGHATSLTGHAFLIISLKTNFGPKEEIFGFYPVSNSLGGIIKGPGMLKADYRCGPNDDCGPDNKAQLMKRLSEVKESVTVPVSLDEVKTVYGVINKWDGKGTIGADDRQIPGPDAKQYNLFDRNCIDFLAAVAGSLGYPVPGRPETQTPVEFLQAFKPLAEQELKIREAKNQAKESKEQAEKADAAARDAQAQRDNGLLALAPLCTEIMEVDPWSTVSPSKHLLPELKW
jgi:hypothetical protein